MRVEEGASSDVYDQLLFPYMRVLIDGVVLPKQVKSKPGKLAYITTQRNGAVILTIYLSFSILGVSHLWRGVRFLVVVIGALGIHFQFAYSINHSGL